ncbi:MAG: YchF-related putative GTPase [Candidatus Aenigmatarchaeota archaeon]|nr:YchF-related putative GTPase [Candidatus Aenigmarchaeota archaeon]
MIEIALVGKPNSGKSTFFKAATLMDVKISNIPFTTLKPNKGIAYISTQCVCKEFNVKCNPQDGFCIDGLRFIPIVLWDVPGLIPEAHKGRGLGAEFLSAINHVDGIIYVIDISGKTDLEGKEVEFLNPIEEVKFLINELVQWYKQNIQKHIPKFFKDKKELIDVLSQKLSGLRIKKEHLEKHIDKIDDLNNFSKSLLFESKKMIIAANKIDEKNSEKNLKELKEFLEKENINIKVVECSALSELILRTLDQRGIIKYNFKDFEILKKNELSNEQINALEKIRELLRKYNGSFILNVLNALVFDVMQYKVVFPVENENKLSDKKGNILPNAILLEKDAKIIDLAEKIHSEIAKNFLYAIEVKSRKKVGKDYILNHRDIIKIYHA